MTLPTSTPNWFDDSEVGASVLNNASASLDSVLHSCLVAGFNQHSVTSIVVTFGVAVATAATHGYTAAFGKLLLIEGAPVPALNGRKQPTAVDTNTFTFPAPGVSDGTYTGTISARRAPLGWSRPHTDGAGKSIYARTAPEATAMMLRVVDTATPDARFARVQMVESASGVDTFTNPTPTIATIADGGFVSKGANSAPAKRWIVVGNDRSIWLATEDISGNFQGYNVCCYFFGDPISFGQVDPYLCLLGCGTDASTNIASMNVCRGFDSTSQDSIGVSTLMTARYSDGITLAGAKRPIFPWPTNQPFGSNIVNAAPSSSIFGVIQSGIHIRESFTGVTRRPITSVLPGLAIPFFHVDDIKAENPTGSVLSVQDRNFVVLLFRTPSTGGMFISLSPGDWHA